jgi:hypothetical protein
VSYTPPQGGRRPPSQAQGGVYGIVSNPAKISHAFLKALPDLLARLPARPICVRFVDRRYRQKALRWRVRGALRQLPCRVEFVAPVCQQDYLDELARVDCVVDSFPYNGGLTTLDTLHCGHACVTRPGSLFAERHSTSHLHFSGARIERPGHSLSATRPGLLAQCSASAHRAVAAALAQLIRV